MKYKYSLPAHLQSQTLNLKEFANGAMQVTLKLTSGEEIKEVLLSDGKYVIAARGYEALPCLVGQIVQIYQNEADERPDNRSGWVYWDNWK